ncbi:MAG: T9SS type A sorting domain-containing protein [Bacteroidota bacterium]
MKKLLTIIFVLLIQTGLMAQCFTADASIWEDTWASCAQNPNPKAEYGNSHWIMYDLGFARNLSKTWVWNTNDPNELDRGFNQVKIDYSMNGNQWTYWGEMTFPQGTGEAVYGGFSGPDMVGLEAQYVLFTAMSNHGDPVCFGLAEVKFNLLPRRPGVPENGSYEVCEAVSNFEVETIDQTTVLFTWDPFEGESILTLDYRIAGTSDWTTIIIEDEEFLLGELLPFETYEYQFNTLCYAEIQTTSIETFTLDTVSVDPEFMEEHDIHIFPNPTKGSVFIEYYNEEQDRLGYYLMDTLKKLINAGHFNHSGDHSVFQLDISSIPNGVYFLQIVNEDEEVIDIERVVKIAR